MTTITTRAVAASPTRQSVAKGDLKTEQYDTDAQQILGRETQARQPRGRDGTQIADHRTEHDGHQQCAEQ